MDKVTASNRLYLEVLAELELTYGNLVKTIGTFDDFLSERLMWMRSVPAMQPKDVANLPREIASLFAPEPWWTVTKALAEQWRNSPLSILSLLVAGALFAGRKRLRATLDALILQASKAATYRFALPLQAIAMALLMALPLPLLLFTVGRELHTLSEAPHLTVGIALGLASVTKRLLVLHIFHILLAPNGLAERLFRWPYSLIILLYKQIGLLMTSFLPTAFLTQVAFYANSHSSGSQILSRLLLLAILTMIALFFYRVLHPATGIWQSFLRERPTLLLARLYPLFFLMIMLVHVVLAGLVISGYFFAVGNLLQNLMSSLWMVFGLVFGHQLIERWLIETSRKLAAHKTQKLKEQKQAGQEVGSFDKEKEQEAGEELDEDLLELSQESRKMLNTLVTVGAGFGLWLVWADTLPALRIFNEFTLWTYVSGDAPQTTRIPVTLADVGFAALIGLIAWMAARHFPSLLKIILLQRLDMSPGSRYTVTTLSRYLIGGIGILWVAEILGFSWSQLKWLVAALGVGIGFGLQEIVANFISGLIILFERPIRVGDVVTVGGTDGTVTRIRIRATTIRDFDGKELLVPNKEFITGNLLNWSLSDPVTRLLLPVGIAYGSDVQAAMLLMLRAAETHELVLKTPKPTVTFDSFGDNALMLTLRCFIGSVDNRVGVRSGLHQAIDRFFREAEITMAFPQRDVHLDTVKPLAIRIVREEEPPPEQSQV